MILGIAMADYTSEADARILIDQRLREAGWDLADKHQVRTELSTSETAIVSDDVLAANRSLMRIDYVLFSASGSPLAVVEAKKSGIDPYSARDQALVYAKSIGAPFVFLSNGESIYFWDYREADARLVSSFFSQRDLERKVHQRSNRQDLSLVPIVEDYIKAG